MAQTKKDIQAALAAAGINPLKRYGQHFLIDGNLLRKLVAAAGVSRSDVVLEVGPGTGTLTEELLATAGHVVAVEIDKGLAGICRARFGASPRFTLLHRDVLESKSQIAPEVLAELSRRRDELAHEAKSDPEASGRRDDPSPEPSLGKMGRGESGSAAVADSRGVERPEGGQDARPPVWHRRPADEGGQDADSLADADFPEGGQDARPPMWRRRPAGEGGQDAHPPEDGGFPGRVMLVANLPYQVATPLIIELLMGEMRVSPLCFTVQREVADRLAAPPGGKDYGPISIFAQALARIERIAKAPPEAFWPAPAVDSTMLRMDVREDAPLSPAVKRELARLVHGCFNHRRKTMRYNLRELLTPGDYDQIETAGRWDLNDRPERISVEAWIDMARALAERTGGE